MEVQPKLLEIENMDPVIRWGQIIHFKIQDKSKKKDASDQKGSNFSPEKLGSKLNQPLLGSLATFRVN